MNRAAFLGLAGMAFRNLGRHRVKTIITTTAVAVSVALYVFMDRWILGMNLESRRNIITFETGAAKAQTEAYFEKRDDLPMYESFRGWEALAAALADEGYDSAPRFVFTGTLHSRSGTAPIIFNAVDPASERRLLRYIPFVESGRFPESGRQEIALGVLAAERLRVGIPERPTREEFENDLVGSAVTPEDEAFIRGLYSPAPGGGEPRGSDARPGQAGPTAEENLALKQDISQAERKRLWGILAASGRMDVRISTVIDIKAAPERIRKERFEAGLLPSLDPEARTLVLSAYLPDPVTGDYHLSAVDPVIQARVLDALVDAEWPGAIRHVNQLVHAVVVGVINSPNPKTNGNVGYIPLDSLQDEAGLMLDGAVTELLVRKTGADDARMPGPDESPGAIREALIRGLAARGSTLPGYLVVQGWEDYVADFLAVSAGDNIGSRLMIMFLFFLSFIGISNTMLMAILERTKETGMLRAQGMTDSQVLLAYVLEAGLIGALGSIAGILIGCLINIPMVEHGIDYSAMARELGGDFGYRIVSVFRSAWNPPVIVGTGIVATLLSAAAAVPPTLRALRIPVTESLRFE
ncbi:MAG TPA: FtsX-like permease family protein [Magnetospirillaceae bacterium]|nr:FtsX-like permease family protein [Magnetospirillaceae bacterium]